MNQHPRKLVTIIAESELETSIVKILRRHEISGYTITDARGHGERGTRSGDMACNSNIRCEVVCKEDVAQQIVETILSQYGKDYAVIAYASDVVVWREEKF